MQRARGDIESLKIAVQSNVHVDPTEMFMEMNERSTPAVKDSGLLLGESFEPTKTRQKFRDVIEVFTGCVPHGVVTSQRWNT